MWGQTGVDLFFVLSGFLITGILVDSKGSKHFFRNFYARRILRIFPLYYGTLTVIYVILPLLHIHRGAPWQRTIWFWTYMQNVAMTFSPGLAAGPVHFWSLAVEEHYYFLWPILVRSLDRDKLLRVSAMIIAVAILAKVILFTIGYDIYFFTLCRMDGLAIGSALAIVARTSGGLARFIPAARRLVLLLITLLAVFELFWHNPDLHLGVLSILESTMICGIYAGVMLIVLTKACGKALYRILAGKMLGSVGKYSYGMYVFHLFIVVGLSRTKLHSGILALVVSFVLTYLAAWLSWTMFERRFLRLKRCFEYTS